MIIDLAQLPPREAYQWMVNTITPRPIAWVSTISAAGKTNLAPFSFFQGVCAKPPTVIFCGSNDRTGKKKDSVINVREVPEFVVNLVPYSLRESMNLTAATLPYGESEFEKFNIPTAPSETIRPPRVADAPVAFECKLERIVELGEGALGSSVVFGTILRMHVNESILNAEGCIDPAKLDVIGRLGGDFYTRTTELFAIKRPD